MNKTASPKPSGGVAASEIAKNKRSFYKRLYAFLRYVLFAALGLGLLGVSFMVSIRAYHTLSSNASVMELSQVCVPRPGLSPEMVVVPSGVFQMGSVDSESERVSNEKQHKVTVKAFAVGRCEVSFAEYNAFAEATGRDKPGDSGWGRGRRPVINVSWHDATAYAAWLSEQTGEIYQLLTEAQWEYAARADTTTRAGTTTAFWFGNTISPAQANYDGNSSYNNGPKGEYRQQTMEVAQFEANAFGLYDVHGNVWEWTCSVYDPNYGGDEQRCANADASENRVLRGGSWNTDPRRLRSAYRFYYAPTNRLINVGFRLARALPLKNQPLSTNNEHIRLNQDSRR